MKHCLRTITILKCTFKCAWNSKYKRSFVFGPSQSTGQEVKALYYWPINILDKKSKLWTLMSSMS